MNYEVTRSINLSHLITNDTLKVIDVGCGIHAEFSLYLKTHYPHLEITAIDYFKGQHYNTIGLLVNDMYAKGISVYQDTAGNFELHSTHNFDLAFINSPYSNAIIDVLIPSIRLIKSGGMVILTPMINDFKEIVDEKHIDSLINTLLFKNLNTKLQLVNINNHPGTKSFPIHNVSLIFTKL